MINNFARISPIGIAAALLLSACSPGIDGRESPGDKHEWSILQGLEFTNRDKPITAPEFVTVAEYEVMSLPSVNGKRIWVLLKPQNPPFYKQMPDNLDFVVQRSFIRGLASEGRVSSTVEEVLYSRSEGE